MRKFLSPGLNEWNSANYLLHHHMDEEMEINLSDEDHLSSHLTILGIQEEPFVYHPEFRSKIIEAMIEDPHAEAELVTEIDGHKLRGKRKHLKSILRRAIEKMREK